MTVRFELPRENHNRANLSPEIMELVDVFDHSEFHDLLGGFEVKLGHFAQRVIAMFGDNVTSCLDHSGRCT